MTIDDGLAEQLMRAAQRKMAPPSLSIGQIWEHRRSRHQVRIAHIQPIAGKVQVFHLTTRRTSNPTIAYLLRDYRLTPGFSMITQSASAPKP